MAIYHLQMQIITRGKGMSSVAAAAYRSCESMTNEYDGVRHDYTHKHGRVHNEIILPAHAPAEYFNRSTLWNAVEKVERYKNSQLAREFEISLPVELTLEQNITLARKYVSEAFVKAGMCADVCIHDKGDGNPHAHIMLTMRSIDEHGAWMPKSRTVNGRKIPSVNWNERERAEEWRRAWAAYANGGLRLAGLLTDDNLLDHRSYERQGIDKIPTIHLGPAAHQMEKRGIRTDRGDMNRAIAVSNRELSQLNARIKKIQKELNEKKETAKPALVVVIHGILARQGQSAYTRLKNGTEAFNFLVENKINNMEDFEKKVASMRGKVHVIRKKLKTAQDRRDTLKAHLEQAKKYIDYRDSKVRYEKLYAQYEAYEKSSALFSKQKSKKALEAANEYYKAHEHEIILYDAAENYLKDALQKHFDPKKLPPVTAWKKELDVKPAEIAAIQKDYDKLKDETSKAENILKEVKELMRAELPRQVRQKSRGLEL